MVVIILIELKIDETPAICKLNIAKSTAGPECDITPLNGGYNVQPVPTPDSTTLDIIKNKIDGIRSQKLKLFSLGKAISLAPIKTGTNQLPKPPINIGITIKKIIIRP